MAPWQHEKFDLDGLHESLASKAAVTAFAHAATEPARPNASPQSHPRRCSHICRKAGIGMDCQLLGAKSRSNQLFKILTSVTKHAPKSMS